MKHAELGNEYFDDSEQAAKEAQGWVKWPRTKEQKQGAVAETAKPPTRAELEANAAALEIKVDGRWSDARLADEIRKVEKELND